MGGLTLRHVTRRYGAVAAVDDVSLDVPDGEFLVLLGPSGSGKSTLLRLIAGIEPADGGEIAIGDRRIDGLLPRFRDVALVFQSYALYPHMSVSANLAFPLRSIGVPRDEIRERVAAVAEQLGLTDLLGRRPGQLSGGQQQRVALGRAIIRRPALFLMDEPLSNLDAKLRARTRLELVQLHRRLAVTTLYVTHDQVEAMTMGQRVAVIESGALRQVGSPEEVYEHPTDVFVADFIGSPPMNLLPARWEVDGDEVLVRGPDAQLSLPLHELGGAAVGAPQEGTLGVRPEYLSIGGGLRRQRIRGRVERVELLGHERLVHLASAWGSVTARVPSSLRAREGETVEVGVAPHGVRLFGADGRLLSSRGAGPDARGPASPVQGSTSDPS